MDKQNEKALESNETMELTPDQMSMISGGTGGEFTGSYTCSFCGATISGFSQFSSHLMLCMKKHEENIPFPQPDPNPSPNPQPYPLPNPDPEPVPFK